MSASIAIISVGSAAIYISSIEPVVTAIRTRYVPLFMQ